MSNREMSDPIDQPSATDLLWQAYVWALHKDTEQAIRHAEGAIEILLRGEPQELVFNLEKRDAEVTSPVAA